MQGFTNQAAGGGVSIITRACAACTNVSRGIAVRDGGITSRVLTSQAAGVGISKRTRAACSCTYVSRGIAVRDGASVPTNQAADGGGVTRSACTDVPRGIAVRDGASIVYTNQAAGEDSVGITYVNREVLKPYVLDRTFAVSKQACILHFTRDLEIFNHVSVTVKGACERIVIIRSNRRPFHAAEVKIVHKDIVCV